jgi:GNAT superfamily N-acetyltransferase
MIIRPVSFDDCSRMATLTQELGYPTNNDKMSEVLRLVMNNPDHEIYIAEIDDQLAGYVHLVSGGSSEDQFMIDIAAMMVDTNFRDQGVGNAFIHKAEESAKSRQANILRIRTSLITPEAYGFFEHRGFVNLSGQAVFVKELNQD